MRILPRPLPRRVPKRSWGSRRCYARGTEWPSGLTAIPKSEENLKKRILIVDDSAVTLRSVKALLDKEYTVAVATSGERAIKEMKKNPPDLVLLDYEMPVCDGKETFAMIRQDEEIKDIPVVFLTAVADKMHIASVLQLNPAGYLLKPPNTEVLKETISAILNP